MERAALKSGTRCVEEGPDRGKRKGRRKEKGEYCDLALRWTPLQSVEERKMRTFTSSFSSRRHSSRSFTRLHTPVATLRIPLWIGSWLGEEKTHLSCRETNPDHPDQVSHLYRDHLSPKGARFPDNTLTLFSQKISHNQLRFYLFI
jgi:hypothetical protein